MRKLLLFGWILAFSVLAIPIHSQAADNWDWDYFKTSDTVVADSKDAESTLCDFGVDHQGSPCWCQPVEVDPAFPVICVNPFGDDDEFLDDFRRIVTTPVVIPMIDETLNEFTILMMQANFNCAKCGYCNAEPPTADCLSSCPAGKAHPRCVCEACPDCNAEPQTNLCVLECGNGHKQCVCALITHQPSNPNSSYSTAGSLAGNFWNENFSLGATLLRVNTVSPIWHYFHMHGECQKETCGWCNIVCSACDHFVIGDGHKLGCGHYSCQLPAPYAPHSKLGCDHWNCAYSCTLYGCPEGHWSCETDKPCIPSVCNCNPKIWSCELDYMNHFSFAYFDDPYTCRRSWHFVCETDKDHFEAPCHVQGHFRCDDKQHKTNEGVCDHFICSTPTNSVHYACTRIGNDGKVCMKLYYCGVVNDPQGAEKSQQAKVQHDEDFHNN